MTTSTPSWLKSIGYIFIGICVAATAYSAYLSVSDQEDKELQDAYKENLKTLTVTDTSGIHEIADDGTAQESTGDNASGIEAVNLGDDLSTEEVLVLDDGDSQLGFDAIDENAVLYTEPSVANPTDTIVSR